MELGVDTWGMQYDRCRRTIRYKGIQQNLPTTIDLHSGQYTSNWIVESGASEVVNLWGK